MELLLQRWRRPGATPGDLQVDGAFECYTLEDPIRERPGVPVAEWKLHGRSAIPAGRYRITLEHSPRFGPNTLTVNGVPGFAGVRIHAGNDVDDTEGCPLVGDGLEAGDTRIRGGTSRPALNRLKAKVRQAIRDRGEEVWLEIRNPEVEEVAA
jgi:hypothetical protein